MSEQNLNNIMVAFEPPTWLLESPDVKIIWQETDAQHEKRVITFVLVQGCKACQQMRSKCACATPVLSEPWVYDREQGLNIFMLRKLGFSEEFMDERRRIAEAAAEIAANAKAKAAAVAKAEVKTKAAAKATVKAKVEETDNG